MWERGHVLSGICEGRVDVLRFQGDSSSWRINSLHCLQIAQLTLIASRILFIEIRLLLGHRTSRLFQILFSVKSKVICDCLPMRRREDIS